MKTELVDFTKTSPIFLKDLLLAFPIINGSLCTFSRFLRNYFYIMWEASAKARGP